MGQIVNAANTPLNRQRQGSVPDVSGALKDYYQSITFVRVLKQVNAFQVVENAEPIQFRGVLFPFTAKQLMLKPEGQRAWSWFSLFCEPGVELKVDDCVEWLQIQYRVMGKLNFELYGYHEIHLILDWVGAGP